MPRVSNSAAAAMHPQFSLIGHSSSDHAFQQVNVVSDAGFTMRAITWNTMDKCHAMSATKNYSNNPMNVDEALAQYRARKLSQIDQIVAFIENRPKTQALDCMFLQEIDWTRMLEQDGNGSTDKVQKEICNYFLKEMNRLGWGYVLSPKSAKNANPSQQDFLTLFDRSSLTHLNNDKGVLPAPNMDNTGVRYRGYQMAFKHKKTGEAVDLVNFHLNYNHDHRNDFMQVMNDSIAKGNTIIMGGDANHPPNFAIETLTGEWNYATAIDLDKNKFLANGELVMTTTHLDADQNNIPKHYDGFCAGSNQALKIYKEKGEHFEVDASNNGALVVDTPNQAHPFHRSEPGYPWMRGRFLLIYLDKQLGTLKDPDQRKSLLAKITKITHERFSETLSVAVAHKKYPLPNVGSALAKNEVADSPVPQNIQGEIPVAEEDADLVLNQDKNASDQSENDLNQKLSKHVRMSTRILMNIDWKGHLERLKEKAQKLRKDGKETPASKIAQGLIKDLEQAQKNFQNSKTVTPASINSFIKSCSDAVTAARPELEKHRGFKGFFSKFMSAIASILTIGIVNAVTKRGFFSVVKPGKTDSAKKLDALMDDVKKMPNKP